jgi:hypothetical protein
MSKSAETFVTTEDFPDAMLLSQRPFRRRGRVRTSFRSSLSASMVLAAGHLRLIRGELKTKHAGSRSARSRREADCQLDAGILARAGDDVKLLPRCMWIDVPTSGVAEVMEFSMSESLRGRARDNLWHFQYKKKVSSIPTSVFCKFKDTWEQTRQCACRMCAHS